MNIDLKAVKQACSTFGWESIYRHYPALDDAMKKGTRAQPCPKTGEGNTRFRFFKDVEQTGGGYHNDVGALPDGIELLTWYTGQSKFDVLKDLVDILGGDAKTYSSPTYHIPQVSNRPYCEPAEEKRRKALIKKVYSESSPIQGTLAEIYLRGRGIKSFSDSYLQEVGNNLRFHPSLPYKEDDNSPWQKFPALLAIVRDKDGKPLTLHRTFLSKDGLSKAPVSRPKMLLAPPRDMRGGYILLDSPTALPDGGHFVSLTEGIENGLSVREGAGCPTWVGISDKLLAMVNLPSTVRVCAVYSDLEESGAGQAAADSFKEKNPRVDVMNIAPRSDKSNIDWNDVYKTQGISGFYAKAKEHLRIPGINFDEFWRG